MEVRLKVRFGSPEKLLGEFTKSVGGGSVVLESRRAVPQGTRFVFELHARGVPEPVEVFGEVVRCAPASESGRFNLNVRYDPSTDRRGLDAVLRRILEGKPDKARRHPRIPIHLRASENTPFSPSYVIKDISRGGLGALVEAPTLPRGVRLGAPFLLEIVLTTGPLMLHGEVVWLTQPGRNGEALIHPKFGVNFGKLRADTIERLNRILVLRGLPPPPWRAKVAFGLDAVAHMP